MFALALLLPVYFAIKLHFPSSGNSIFAFVVGAYESSIRSATLASLVYVVLFFIKEIVGVLDNVSVEPVVEIF